MGKILKFPKVYSPKQIKSENLALLYEFQQRIYEIELQKIDLLNYIVHVQEQAIQILHNYREHGFFQEEIESNIEKCNLRNIVTKYFNL
jgi:hypothetical protein